MAVNCLTKHQKKYIKYFHHTNQMSQRALARKFKVSARTIGRVLIEPEDLYDI